MKSTVIMIRFFQTMKIDCTSYLQELWMDLVKLKISTYGMLRDLATSGQNQYIQVRTLILQVMNIIFLSLIMEPFILPLMVICAKIHQEQTMIYTTPKLLTLYFKSLFYLILP